MPTMPPSLSKRIDWSNVLVGLLLSLAPSAATMYVGHAVLTNKVETLNGRIEQIGTRITAVDTRAEKGRGEVRDELRHEIDQLHQDVRELRTSKP